MTKSNKRERVRLNLSTKLLIVVVGGLVLATILFFFNTYIISTYIKKVYLNDKNTKERNYKHIESFADFVFNNKVSSADLKSILTWQEMEDNVYILVYQNDKIIYDSTWWADRKNSRFFNKFAITDKDTGEVVVSENEKKEILRQIKLNREERKKSGYDDAADTAKSTETQNYGANNEYAVRDDSGYRRSEYYIITENNETNETMQYGFYPVRFSDGVYDVCILDYSESQVYTTGLLIAFLISCLFFVSGIIIYHKREIRRVIRLTNEVKSVECDNLDSPISFKGHDEIHDLSVSIDNMRSSIIDQMGKEKAAWQANSDLVTSMAHDIRTPLTVLAGYLNLIKEKDYSTEEELEQYIDISVDKAEQLRELSDKLFKYFFVYSKSEDKINLEKFDAVELFNQMVGEYIVLLEDKGFTFKTETFDQKVDIKTDIQYLKRLTDNIFTNVRKYADKSKPVKITYSLSKNKVKLRVKNEISRQRSTAESTRIGLLTCEKIAEQLGGSFRFEERGTSFIVTLEFPVL